jgi:hypothetical protein
MNNNSLSEMLSQKMKMKVTVIFFRKYRTYSPPKKTNSGSSNITTSSLEGAHSLHYSCDT